MFIRRGRRCGYYVSNSHIENSYVSMHLTDKVKKTTNGLKYCFVVIS